MTDEVNPVERHLRDLSAGIRLILEELREGRRGAEEDRKRGELHFEGFCRHAADVRTQARQDRRDQRRRTLLVRNIAMDIRGTLKAHTVSL